MKSIETFYLIDYENVNSDGLKGCDKLTESEHIIIFFTKNAMKINMSDIADHGEAKLKMIEVPAGKQSTDIHISSYIGYLAGIYRGQECRIVVISKDSDFDNVLKFWESETGMKAFRAKQIKTANTSSSEKSESSQESADNINRKTKLNNEIKQSLSKAEFDNEIVSYVASTAVKNIDVKNSKQQTYRTIISKYGQEKGLNIYGYIKKLI